MSSVLKWLFFLLVASRMAFGGSPNSVVVNGTKWRIVREHEIVLEHGQYDGYTFCDKHIIRIADDIGRCFEAVTLFHELEHASVCDQGFEAERMTGHEAIERLAFGMSKIIADNPKLRRYLGKARNCSWTDAE
jgi:hypothetical protein